MNDFLPFLTRSHRTKKFLFITDLFFSSQVAYFLFIFMFFISDVIRQYNCKIKLTKKF